MATWQSLEKDGGDCFTRIKGRISSHRDAAGFVEGVFTRNIPGISRPPFRQVPPVRSGEGFGGQYPRPEAGGGAKLKNAQ